MLQYRVAMHHCSRLTSKGCVELTTWGAFGARRVGLRSRPLSPGRVDAEVDADAVVDVLGVEAGAGTIRAGRVEPRARRTTHALMNQHRTNRSCHLLLVSPLTSARSLLACSTPLVARVSVTLCIVSDEESAIHARRLS